ncbi:MAG: diguanylate cyclase [Candidatus Riflebacteria bacterium]|nr:diguanylate cyclase [Candidatus Riflebacteria bacterium]
MQRAQRGWYIEGVKNQTKGQSDNSAIEDNQNRMQDGGRTVGAVNKDTLFIDGLTGLPTHLELARQLSVSASPIAVFFDIDALVRLTDMCGFRASDEAIIRVGRIIQERAATLDLPAFRIGGDEFLVTLRGQTHANAVEFAQTTLAAVSTARIEYRRADDPSREHIVVNAVICRVSWRIEPNISRAREWFAEKIWKAKMGDIRRCGVIADEAEGLPTWAA